MIMAVRCITQWRDGKISSTHNEPTTEFFLTALTYARKITVEIVLRKNSLRTLVEHA